MALVPNDVRETEPPADDPAVTEEAFYLVGMYRADKQILRPPPRGGRALRRRVGRVRAVEVAEGREGRPDQYPCARSDDLRAG